MRRFLVLIKDLVLVLAVLLIMAGGLFGVGLPFRFPIAEVGEYQLAAFDSGLALYQFGRRSPFYSMSPLNDFYVTEEGYRATHLSNEEFEAKEFETNLSRNKPLRIYEAVVAYFGKLDPKYVVTKEGVEVWYESEVSGNEAEITKTIKFDEPTVVNGQGVTFSYDPGDIVFDPVSLRIYSSATREEIRLIEELYGLKLVPSGNVFVSGKLSQKAVSLVNPSVPGVITVKAGLGQEMLLDNRFRFVEITTGEKSIKKNARISFRLMVAETLGRRE